MLTKSLANEAAVHDDDAISAALSEQPVFSTRSSTANGRTHNASDLLKRVMDLFIAVPMALFLLPFFMLIAIVVYTDDKGPILFKQKRRGMNGEYFTCLKVRTMVTNASERLEHLLATNPAMRAEWEETQKLKNDPRITGVGDFLRKYSLDELPQLWNIIKGDMSIVGPRPIVADEVRRYDVDIAHYDAVRPGVIGLWQISGRNDTSYDKRVELDVTYATKRNILMDLKILVLSIPAIVLKRGAY
ncbi:MAG: sugar transferase [Hyphomonadaceae bacterium]|nr:sugar transferase [Hyphomonadaceae bacterium]